MIQHIGRCSRRKLQIDIDTVSLIRPDLRAGLIEREPLFAVPFHHFAEGLAGQGELMLPAGRQQIIDLDPATLLQRQPDTFRRVPQMLGEIFTFLDQLFFCNCVYSSVSIMCPPSRNAAIA